MKTLKLIAAFGLGALLGACGATVPDITSRNAPFEVTPPVAAPVVPAAQYRQSVPSQQASPLSVSAINIVVPRSLSVSEANGYYPKADIVWRGDPIGDRHAQIKAIFEAGFQAGTAEMAGPTEVILDVEVIRFHSVTEKTRYSVGGVHNMVFNLTVRRASNGQALAPTREVMADLPALGGRAAIEADRQGQTQKVRVTDYLAFVIQQELARYIFS